MPIQVWDGITYLFSNLSSHTLLWIYLLIHASFRLIHASKGDPEAKAADSSQLQTSNN